MPAKCSTVLAMLLNRLATNTMPASWQPQDESLGTTVVRLTTDGADIATPEAMLAALRGELGAAVDLQIVSRVTGFGYGFAVREGGVYKQTPLAFPVRTGITIMDGVAESSGNSEVMSLMNHAEVALRLRLRDGTVMRVSWYQGIEGFTGWHPADEAEQPWNNSSEMEVTHTTWSDARTYRAVMQSLTSASVVINRAADVLGLPHGGYGYLGVCNDSVAMVQAGIGEKVSQYPCILAGTAKATMCKTFTEFADNAEAHGQTELADRARAVRTGMLNNPCDVVHRPSSMLGAIRRVSACIPPVTPFATLERARRDLQRAKEQLVALNVGDDEADIARDVAAEVKTA